MSRQRRRRQLVRNPLRPIEPRFSASSVILGDMPDLFELDDETTEPHPTRSEFRSRTGRKELER